MWRTIIASALMHTGYKSKIVAPLQTIAKALRLDGSSGVDAGGYFDLWTPHETSGSLDPDIVRPLL